MLENDQKRRDKSDILLANQLKLVYKWQRYACNESINCTKHLHVTLISQKVSARLQDEMNKHIYLKISLSLTSLNDVKFSDFSQTLKKIYNPLTFLWLVATTSTVYYPQKSCFNFLDFGQNPSV